MSTGAKVLERYADLGIPIHHYAITAKGSNETGWPELAAKGEPIEGLIPLVGKNNFGAETGIETPGGFLADIDFDSEKPEVNAAGSAFLLGLLPTATFGRKSKPIAHAMYFTNRPLGNEKAEGVIELRGTKKDGSLGLQTMVAPSVHPEAKETLEWCDPEFQIASVSADELEFVYRMSRDLMIILQHTEKHFDHETRLAAAAHFLKSDLDEEIAIRLMTAIAQERDVKDLDDVHRAVKSTAEKIHTNGALSVKPFAEWLGPEAAKLLKVMGKSKEIVTIRASDIEPRAVHWLWENKLPLGENALMTGREDTGKSTVLLELAAQITKGKLPGVYQGQPRDVVIATTEDSWHHTIVPRLMAAGADLNRIHQIAVRIENLGVVELSLPDDVRGLEDKIEELRAALVIVDPLIPKLNRKLDSHKDQEVRRGLEPLIGVAHRTGCSIIGIVHHNKSSTSDPLNAVMGSKAFTATVRAVMSVLVEDGTRYLCLPKHNLGKEQPSLTFRISGLTVGEEKDGTPITAGRVEWLKESKETAEQIMSRKQQGNRGEKAIDRAIEWLSSRLAGKDAVPSKALKEEAIAAGHSRATIERAAKSLGVLVSGNKGTETQWFLPF